MDVYRCDGIRVSLMVIGRDFVGVGCFCPYIRNQVLAKYNAKTAVVWFIIE